jgi:predicted exporter
MSTTEGEARTRVGGPMRSRLVIYAAVLLAVFLLGLIPMWIAARGRAADRDAARRELRLCRLENNLLSAAVESRRGEYESARSAASNFFTSLHEQVDLVSEPSDLTPAQKESLRPLLNQRDDLITLLARSDPASADRLAEIYMSYRKGMGNVQP